jgi:hypothetical protein
MVEPGPADNIHLSTTDGNGPPGFHRSEPPARYGEITHSTNQTVILKPQFRLKDLFHCL